MSRPACEHGTPLIYDCPVCPYPTPPTYPTSTGFLSYAFTPDGLHLSLWTPGEGSRETTLEPHHALEMARAILREFGGRG